MEHSVHVGYLRRKTEMSNSAFPSFSMQAGQPASVLWDVDYSHHVVICTFGHVISRILPHFHHSAVKHARQNIQNDCHQWLSHSFRLHHTVLSISYWNNVVFLRSVCCNIVFSLEQTDGHDCTIPKTSWWIENCTKFGQFILRKIIKIVATSCQILRLKCTKFDFGWGSALDLSGGAYSAPPDLLAGF